MLIYLLSKLVNLVFGLLYPAYASFIAVKNKDVRSYVQWMMYWIVYAFYSFCEAFTDTLLGPWFPFYYELKIILLLWLMSPATSGAGVVYRRFIHPKLLKYEPEIEFCIMNVQNKTSAFVFQWSGRVMKALTDSFTETFWNVAVRAGNPQLLHHLQRSCSLNDLDECDNNFGQIQGQSGTKVPAVTGRIHSSASVGTTPMDQMDVETFFSEQMQQDFYMGMQHRNILPEEEEVIIDGEVGEVEFDNCITQSPPKLRGASRRKKEVPETSIYGTVPRRKKGAKKDTSKTQRQ